MKDYWKEMYLPQTTSFFINLLMPDMVSRILEYMVLCLIIVYHFLSLCTMNWKWIKNVQQEFKCRITLTRLFQWFTLQLALGTVRVISKNLIRSCSFLSLLIKAAQWWMKTEDNGMPHEAISRVFIKSTQSMIFAVIHLLLAKIWL